jgi:SOS-response transcriptional repressor LexA
MRHSTPKTALEREQELIEKIEAFRGIYGYSPSYSQLGKLMGLSKARIAKLVEILIIKKQLAKDGNKARTLTVLC